MGVIPDEVYRLVEEKLKARWKLVPQAKAALYRAQQEALSLSAPAMDQDRVRSGKPGNRTQAAALRILEAEEKLAEAEKWADVFRLMNGIFPPDSSVEGAVAAALYDRGLSQEELCRVMRCDRQTVRRRRDNYVCHTALVAASHGLIAFFAGRSVPDEKGPLED